MRKKLTYFLCIVFCSILLPRELLHDLHHHDTVHHCTAGEDLAFETQHLHCDVFHLETLPFVGNTLLNVPVLIHHDLFSYSFLSVNTLKEDKFKLKPSRGPPVV